MIIYLLKIIKNALWIIGYRNKVSIFAILIRNGARNILNYKSELNKYAYEINRFYNSFLIGSYDPFILRFVIDYKALLKHYKVRALNEPIIKVKKKPIL